MRTYTKCLGVSNVRHVQGVRNHRVDGTVRHVQGKQSDMFKVYANHLRYTQTASLTYTLQREFKLRAVAHKQPAMAIQIRVLNGNFRVAWRTFTQGQHQILQYFDPTQRGPRAFLGEIHSWLPWLYCARRAQ